MSDDVFANETEEQFIERMKFLATVDLGGIYAVFLPVRHPPAKVRAFIDFIAARFTPEPPWDRDIA